jgi:23S rRNA pseudouridine1911/1915/1917 synthase
MKEYIADEELKNLRIDKAISEKDSNFSRVAIQRMLEEENILVNGKKVKASYKLQVGDKITIEEPEVKESTIEPENIPLDII